MSKEHAYAYEAGYRDGSINYELEHCPACKNVADLQEALAENAKLQELVQILAYCMSEDRDCDRCTLNGAEMPTPIISACDSLPDRIHELGVEVGDGQA